MNLLITGGAGFIGSNFIWHIHKKYPQYRIYNIDKLTYAGNKKNLKGIDKKKGYFFIHADITNKKTVQKIFQKYSFDAVVHFAAESHVDRSIKKPQTFLRTNVLGTQVLLQTSLEHNIQRFIQISTDEVYGALGKTGQFSEKTPLNPSSPYSASKASADLIALSYFHTYKLPVIITRTSNNYGPRQFPEKLIPLFIQRLLRNKTIPVYGRGENIRDWIHVQDNCEAIDQVLHHGAYGQIYNIGANTEKSNMEIVQFLLRELEKPKSLITYVPDRLGHDYRYSLSTEKIEKELGWKSKIPFEQGMLDTIAWYKKAFGSS